MALEIVLILLAKTITVLLPVSIDHEFPLHFGDARMDTRGQPFIIDVSFVLNLAVEILQLRDVLGVCLR